MNQASTHASVSNQEGMDRLELRVSDGGLEQPGKVGSIDERAEVEEKARQLLGGRRDVVRVVRPDVLAPDPGLDGAHLAGLAGLVRGLHEHGVDGPQIVGLEVDPARPQLDRPFHRTDVADHGPRGPRRRGGVVERACQATVGRPRALHARRGHALRPQELVGEGLEVLAEVPGLHVAGAAAPARLQVTERTLRLGQELGQPEGQAHIQALQSRRYVRAVAQGLAPGPNGISTPTFDGTLDGTLDLGHEIPSLGQSSWFCHDFMRPGL